MLYMILNVINVRGCASDFVNRNCYMNILMSIVTGGSLLKKKVHNQKHRKIEKPM